MRRARTTTESPTGMRRSDLVVVPVAWAVDMSIWVAHPYFGHRREPWVAILVISVAAFATLTLRRRYPVAVLALHITSAVIGTLLSPLYVAFTGVLIALQALAARHPPARSALGLVACALPFGLQGHRMYDGSSPDTPMAWLVSALAAGAAWYVGYRSWAADVQLAAEVERQRRLAIEEALRAERLRVARELHDIVAHAMSIIVVQAGGARAVFDTEPARAREALGAIQRVGTQGMGELRRLLGLLRSAAGEDDDGFARQPGLADVEHLLDEARAAGIAVTRQIDGEPGELAASVSLTAYRLIQEALTNTMKHAGAGAAVRVQLVWSSDHLAVTVEDRVGRGPQDPAALSTGHGLLGLRERVTTVGGVLHHGPVAGGYVVHALLPLADSPSVPAAGHHPDEGSALTHAVDA